MSPELMDFLTGIATDPDRMTRYTADPEAEMAATDLPAADRESLRKTDLADMVMAGGGANKVPDPVPVPTPTPTPDPSSPPTPPPVPTPTPPPTPPQQSS